MPTFYFIAGASGSGKTAIIPRLKETLGKLISVYDFDDIGVPHDADKKWRQESTEKWLQRLRLENKDACLLGQVVLGEILACPSAKEINEFNFCFLDVIDSERIKRLTQRNMNLVDQNMLNWSSWLRMHHQDPQWRQHVLKDDSWQGLDFSRWENLKHWDSLAVIKKIDTTALSIQQVSELVAKWINERTNA